MDKLSNTITDIYIKKEYVPADKHEIYSYGFKLIIADIINFSMVMLLGVLMGKFIESVVFLVTLCGVRQFSGGFHAKTFWLCRVSMLVTFLSVIAAVLLLKEFAGYNIWGFGTANGIFTIFISILSPVNHPDKILTEQQRKENKLKAMLTSLILSIISCALILVGRVEGVTISITLAAVVILMIIGTAVGKGEKIMIDKIGKKFMSFTAKSALKAAVYSASVASQRGMHQIKEPETLQEIANEYKASHSKK